MREALATFVRRDSSLGRERLPECVPCVCPVAGPSGTPPGLLAWGPRAGLTWPPLRPACLTLFRTCRE